MFYLSSFYLCQLSYILYGLKECWLSIWLQLDHFILKHLDMWLTMICTCGLNILVVRQIYPHSHTTQLKILIPKPERLKPIERENSNAPMAPIHPSHTLTSKPHQWPEIGQVQNGDPNHSVHLRWGDETFVPKIVEAPKKRAQNCKPIKNQLRETMERIFDREEKRSSSSGRKEMIDNFQSLERELVASF